MLISLLMKLLDIPLISTLSEGLTFVTRFTISASVTFEKYKILKADQRLPFHNKSVTFSTGFII